MHSSMAVTNEAEIKITMTWPPTQEVLDKIVAETLVAHAVRQLSRRKKDVTTMMGTIQRQLVSNPGGWRMEWEKLLC